MQQDIWANPAEKNAHKFGERWLAHRKIVGFSVASLAPMVCAILVAYWWGYRPAIVLAGGLLLFSFSFMTVIHRVARPEMDNPFRRGENLDRETTGEENVGAMLDGLPGNYAVLHDVNAGRGSIGHLVFRQDGAVFLIETRPHARQAGQLCWNRQSWEKDFNRQTLDHIGWLKQFLKAHAVFEPWIHAAIVLTDAHAEEHLNAGQIDVLDASCLKRWLERARGNPRAAVILWPQVENLKNELMAPDSMHLACQPLLR
jgi:hypothetical protein